MHPIRYRHYSAELDLRERDAKLRKLNSDLSLARMQGNKHRITEISKHIRKIA
jgi:hypothetical protein